MGVKKYVVREGFNFRIKVETEKGMVEKVFNEGDPLTLEQEVGDAAHQLEYASEKDRTDAAAAEAEARKAVAATQPSTGFDPQALADAIAAGIAAGVLQVQQAAPKA